MAKKQVIWSIKAQQDRIAILKYWIERDKTKTYSKKLFVLFNQAADLISDHPKIGKPTNYGSVRFKVVQGTYYSLKKWKIRLKYCWFGIADKT